MKEKKNKNPEIADIYQCLDQLNDRLVQAANYIKKKVELLEEIPITSSMSKEDILFRHQMMEIGKNIEQLLRGDKENV